MVSKKYVGDFEIEYDEKPGGRLKARAVYKGKLYVFSDSAEKMRKTVILFTLLTMAGWIAFLLPLLIVSSAGHTSYVIFPHACFNLALLYMSAVTYDLLTARPPFTHEKSDKISQRTPKTALFMMLLSGAAAAGFVIHLVVDSDVLLPGDIVFGLCEAVMLGISILLFKNRGRTATRETSSPSCIRDLGS